MSRCPDKISRCVGENMIFVQCRVSEPIDSTRASTGRPFGKCSARDRGSIARSRARCKVARNFREIIIRTGRKNRSHDALHARTIHRDSSLGQCAPGIAVGARKMRNEIFRTGVSLLSNRCSHPRHTFLRSRWILRLVGPRCFASPPGSAKSRVIAFRARKSFHEINRALYLFSGSGSWLHRPQSSNVTHVLFVARCLVERRATYDSERVALLPAAFLLVCPVNNKK